MWNWYSGDESQPSGAPPADQSAGTMSVADLTEQLAQTQQLVAQLKDLIREKDNELRKKDQDLKEEKESSESKVSKAKLQNKAKIASLTSQLEDLKKQLASSGAQVKKPESKKGSGDGDQENASANRGKILVLRKRVEELETQLAHKNEELKKKEVELEAQRLRGSELDAMIIEKEEKLAKKEAYIKDLQLSAASNIPVEAAKAEPNAKTTATESTQDLQVLIQNLTRKVEQGEEKYSLLHEQTESLKAFLNKEKSDFQEKEAMYMENIRVYQNIILEKDKEMKLLAEKHDQELFKIAAKSDSTAELHQLLKALKQKLHEDEEVLSGKNQVIDVLQKELDNKDQQMAETAEKCRLLQSEKQNLLSKLDAEKHVMRAQLKDMMEKHQTEMQALSLRHEGEIKEKFQTILQLQNQLQGLASPGDVRDGSAVDSTVIKLQDQVKLKTEESETKNQELSLLTLRIGELEEEKKALAVKLESVADLQSINEQLLTKLVVYEEQQRILQADLEQVTKRADSQTSESGSVDEMQNPLLEWSEMSQETDIAPDQEREDTSVMVLRMAQIEEEREGLIEDDWFFPGCSDPAMDSGQVELEEELSAARGLGKLRTARRKGSRGANKIQDDFSFSDKSFEEQHLATESGDVVEGENMGGWWPEYGSSNSGLGLRAVVEELEMERNQLQEQIMTLEERCQELEDRLQLQLRIESLQSENERFQTQLAQIRQQQSQEAEKHHDLISTLNDQLKGLTNRNAFLENAIVEKEQSILDATEKLNKLGRTSKALQEKEVQNKELLEKLDQYEHQLEEVTRRQQASESENSMLKMANAELTEKVSAFKDRVSTQDSSLEKLQVDLDQTNDELDRLNTSHLEKQSQLLHNLQRSEREVDVLKELLQEKDKEMSSLSASLTEYSEQVTILKETIDFKEDQMAEMSNALVKMERELHHAREAQTLDVQESSSKILSLSEQLREMESELSNAKHVHETKTKESEELNRQINENDITIKNLRLEIQAQAVTHNNHLTECSAQIVSLKEQMNASAAKVDETEMKWRKEVESLKIQLEADHAEKERLAVLVEEKSALEQSFQNELKTAKEEYNKLVSELSKKDEAIKELSSQLSEHKDRSNRLDEELSSKQKEFSSLQMNLEALAQSKEELVKNLQEKTEDFQKHIDTKTDVINKLHSETEKLRVQSKDLQASLAEKEKSLKSVMNSVEELERKVHDLEDQHRHISNEKENLLTQVSQKESEISAMTQSLKDIQNTLSKKEQELSDLQNTISNLQREKEDLHKEIDLISAQSLQNSNTTTAELQAKTKECFDLGNQLREEWEAILKLQAQIQSLEKDLKESRIAVEQKEEALKAKSSDCDSACERLKQNEEKNLALQRQLEGVNQMVASKEQVLEEKEMLLTRQSAQIEEMRRNLDQLQSDEQALREVNLKVSENVEKLNIELGKLQQDFGNKVEENTKLRAKVKSGSKQIEKLSHERESCLLSISNLETQRDALQSQVAQSQSVVDSLTQQLNILMTEKDKLYSDTELLKTTLSSKSEEVSVLSSHSSQQGHTILSLKDQIDLLQVEKRDLLCSVEEKDTLLLQKEELIRQTEKKLEGEGQYLQTISALQNELQSSASDCTQQRQRIHDQEQELQKLRQEMQLLKNKSEEAELLKTQLAEHVVIISDLHSQVKNLKENVEDLNGALTKKDECLKEKVDSYANLKAQLSDFQDTIDEQRRSVETLLHDNAQSKAAVSEKDLTIKNSLLEIEGLKEKCQSKEEQCNTLLKQVASLEETNTKHLDDLKKLTLSLEEQETSHCKKEETLNVELEKNKNLSFGLQKTVDEFSHKIKVLEQSVLEKENTVQNLQEKYASLYEQKQELAESNSHKEAEISKLMSSVSEKDAKLQMLESNVQAFSSEVNLLREELDKGSSNVKNISEALKLKDDIISQHQKAEEGLRTELQSLKVEYQGTTAQLQALMGERDETKALVQNLQDQCTSQSQYIKNLKQDVDNLNSRLLQDQQTFALERQQLESTRQEKLQLESFLQTLQVDRDTSLTKLQNELKDKNTVIGNLQRQVQEVEARISSDAESLNTLKAENTDLQKQVTELINNSASESLKLRTRIQELERLLLEARSMQEKLEKEITGYQDELSELRSEKNVLVAEAQALRHQLSTSIAGKERQAAELPKIQETAKQSGTLYGEKGVERIALVGGPAATEKGHLAMEDKEQTKNEIQRYLHEIRQRDLVIQQLNTKAMQSVEMNGVLSAQLKSVSQGLKDTQMRYTDLQNQYYKLQRDLQVTRVADQNDILTEVPPGAPQERANVLVEIDNAELADLRRRLAEAEVRHDATQQELTALSDRLAEEKAQREAAEEALHLTEIHNKRLETKSSSRDYEFSLQMESDDEREALIIDPSQNIALRTMKSCNVAVRRWLHGRSLYCSKLLASRSKSRYLLLTYLLGLHVLILMCLSGAL